MRMGAMEASRENIVGRGGSKFTGCSKERKAELRTMEDPNVDENQQSFRSTSTSPLAKVSGWTPINQPSSSPPQSNLSVKSDVKPKKRKSRRKTSNEATHESSPTRTKHRKRTKLDPSEHGDIVGPLGVPQSQISPVSSSHKCSQKAKVLSKISSTDQGSEMTGFISLEAISDVAFSTQDTLHLSRAAVQAPLGQICDADRDAQLLAEQADFDDFGVDDQAYATSDEWFEDEDLQEAGPEWLDVAHIAQPTSDKVYQWDTKHDADYDQLVALAESSPPLSQVSGNRVKSDPYDTLELDQPTIENSAPCTESSLMESHLSENIEPGTVITGPKAPSGQTKMSFHALQMRPPPRPIAAHEVRFNADGVPLPFVRRPFPKALVDDSPVRGLQNRTVLRTVFRVGEAINAASSKKDLNAIVELYARVIRSSRMDFKQHFLFADLFTEKPPYLRGTYGIWRGVELWEQDSDAFLGDGNRGKMCRVVGMVQKNDSGSPHMNVLSIWVCDYEDVGTAKGIACS